MAITLRVDSAAITRRVVQAADRGVVRAAHIWRNEYVRLVLRTPKSGRIYGRHQASAPGQPFASDTGRTLQSVRVRHQPGSARATLLVGVKHARALEYGTRNMAARPAFRPALANKRKEMIAAIRAELRKAT